MRILRLVSLLAGEYRTNTIRKLVYAQLRLTTHRNQWYSNALTQCAELSAAATVIGYWDGGNSDAGPSITPAAWITILVVLILALNIFAVGVYGEAE